MSVQPVIRQVDYLDTLERELLAQALVCPTHRVILEKGRCCVCKAEQLERSERRAP